MSKYDCALCGKDAEGENVWFGKDFSNVGKICVKCSRILAGKLNALLKLDGLTSDEYGVTIHWHEIQQILASLKWNPTTFASEAYFALTDRDSREIEVEECQSSSVPSATAAL